MANYHPRDAGVGAMINVAGTGILDTAKNPEGAHGFVDFLLGQEAQRHFAEHEFEYPVVAGAPAPEGATPLSRDSRAEHRPEQPGGSAGDAWRCCAPPASSKPFTLDPSWVLYLEHRRWK